VGELFDDWRIESRASNVIGIGIPSKPFVAACRGSLNAAKTIIRLTKRGGAPFLSFSMTSADETTVYTTDLPVLILAGDVAKDLEEPRVPDVTLQMQAPGPRSAQAVLERMRALRAKRVRLDAASAGVLSFSTRVDMVAVQSFFQDLGQLGGASTKPVAISATVDLASMLQVVTAAGSAQRVSTHMITLSVPTTFGWLCALEGGVGSSVFLLSMTDATVMNEEADEEDTGVAAMAGSADLSPPPASAASSSAAASLSRKVEHETSMSGSVVRSVGGRDG